MKRLLTGYKPTIYEKWVSEIFIEKGILTPWDLDMFNIAEKFGITIFFDNFACSIDDELMGIILPKYRSENELRKIFFHELGHLLRHKGDQRIMNKSMKDYQENDAHLFANYALMPLHMLDYLDIDNPNIVEEAAELFQVEVGFAWERINKICANYTYAIQGII